MLPRLPVQRGAPARPAEHGSADQGRVWVLRDGKPVRVAVTTGLDDDTYTEIVKGEINPDDQVIIAEQRSSNSSGGRAAAPRLR